jgi:hypothetical protein
MTTYDIRTLGADDNERHTVRRRMEDHPAEVLRSYRFFKNINRVIETVYAGDPLLPISLLSVSFSSKSTATRRKFCSTISMDRRQTPRI